MPRPSEANTTSEPTPINAICREVEAVDGCSIRPWDVGDAEVLAAAWADPEIARWNPVPPDMSVGFARRWISGTEAQNEASVGIDVVLVDASNVLSGEIGLQVDPSQGVAEVGFWLAADARGQGLGRTLLTLAERLADALELRGLVALVDQGNDSALGLLTAAGWNEVPTTSDRRAFARRVA